MFHTYTLRTPEKMFHFRTSSELPEFYEHFKGTNVFAYNSALQLYCSYHTKYCLVFFSLICTIVYTCVNKHPSVLMDMSELSSHDLRGSTG